MGSVSAVVFIGLLIVVVIGVGLRRALQRPDAAHPGEGRGVRRFFQYLLLYGLLVVAATGLSGLVTKVFENGRSFVGTGELALYVTFTVVGVPLYVALAWWTARRLRADPQEGRSRGWHVYVTAVSLTALYSALVGLHGVLSWAVGLEGYQSSYIGALLVWGAVWFGHWWVDRRLSGPESFLPHQLLGSVVGLVLTAVGAVTLVGGAIETVLGTGGPVLDGARESAVLPGAVLLATGVPVWLVYWLLPGRRYRRTALWLVHVVVVGVGGGLVTAVSAGSVALYDVLVWFVGEPSTTVATTHFGRAPWAVAAVAVGSGVWWYHRAVLAGEGQTERTEVRRVYEYLVAGIGLVGAAVGMMLMLAALLEALAGAPVGPPGVVAETSSTTNTVLAGATMLVVGGPVWWVFWRRIEGVVANAPVPERSSTTRRVYVAVLFGVVGVAAVIALLSGVFVVLQDVFQGALSAQTLRAVAYPGGIIVTAGLVSAYHWRVYRGDRKSAVTLQRGPQFVLLVGPASPDIGRALSVRTRGRVEVWARTDGDPTPWSVDELAALLVGCPEHEVVVVAEGGRLTVVPVDRAPSGSPVGSHPRA